MVARRILLAASFLLVGVALLANPYYLWPHHGDDAYEVSATAVVGGDDPTPIGDLPPETATVVEAAIERSGEDDPPTFEDRDAIPTDGLSWSGGRPIVATGDAAYQIRIDRADRSPPVLPEHRAVRVGTGLAGSLSLALGAVTATRGAPRFTPRRAWSVVGIWAAVLLATVAYDGGGHGIGLADPNAALLSAATIRGVSVVGVAALLLPAVGVAVGAAARSRGWRDLTDRGAILAVAFVAGTAFVSLPGVLVGYVLGEPPARERPRFPGDSSTR